MVAKDGQETSRNPGKQNFQLFNFTSAPDRWLKKPGHEAKDSKGYGNQKW